MDDLKSLLLFIGVVAIVFLVIIVLPVTALGMVSCSELSNMHTDIEFRYKFWTGCRALFDGVWVSSENLYLVVGQN